MAIRPTVAEESTLRTVNSTPLRRLLPHMYISDERASQAKWNHIVNMPCTLYRMPSGEYEEKLMKVKLQVRRTSFLM